MNKTVKKHIANILTILMVFAFLPLGVVHAEIASPKPSVQFEIRGDAKMGTIYNEKVPFNEGENAFNLLKLVLNANNIPLEYEEEWQYVTGINGLKQTDKGPNSGWMYKINNKSPDVGAGDLILKDNDHVLFYYTLDYTVEDTEEKKDDVAQEVVVKFSDKKDISPWALESVEKAIEKGLIGGDDKGRLNPTKNITRAEFVKLLLVVMNEEPDVSFKELFPDVSKDAWYADVVEKAAELGLINGDQTGNFLPRETISRQDMAVILTKAFLKNDVKDKKPNVSDANKISPYAVNSVAAVIDNNLMSGVGDNKFSPKGNVTREMAISVMIRILGNK